MIKIRIKKIKNNPKGPKKPKKLLSQILNMIIIILLIITSYSLISGIVDGGESVKVEKVSMSQLIKEIDKQGDYLNYVATTSTSTINLLVEDNKVSLDVGTNTQMIAEKESGVSFFSILNNYNVATDTIAKLNITIKEASKGNIFLSLIPILLPTILIFVFFWFLLRGVKGANGQAMSFGQTRAKKTDPNDNKHKITFKDVAGNKEAKAELEEVVDFLKNPKKFIEIGATTPKGLLLMGAPGTGKTLLARAVAGEAKVPFYHLSGSEFVEMFVGVGASRVRDLFKEAKQHSPAIIFIDEIDAVGRSRGIGLGGGNDEREQTLNQILVEMDGFDPNEKLIVIAATNRPDVLDKALLRPGRFDRRVNLDLPDRESRKDILTVHKKKKPFAEDVNLEVIAERTVGFSGADLASVMNEAAILTAVEDRKIITQNDLIRSVEKVMLGPERKSHIFSTEEKIKTAYHEAGHAIVASLLPKADPVHKISIISRGNAGGYTLKLPLDDKKLLTKKYFIDELAMAYGGYATEEIIYGDVSTGPSGDLQMTSNIAKEMVVKYGMSELVGPFAIENDNQKVIYGNLEDSRNIFGVELANIVDKEIQLLCRNGLDTAKKIINANRELLEKVKDELLAKETIERVEFEEILKEFNIPIKK